MKNGRRKFSGKEKMAILRRHLVEEDAGVGCVRSGWDQPDAVLPVAEGIVRARAEVFGRRNDDGLNRKLEEKVADKGEVIGEIMAPHVRLKKSWRNLVYSG